MPKIFIHINIGEDDNGVSDVLKSFTSPSSCYAGKKGDVYKIKVKTSLLDNEKAENSIEVQAGESSFSSKIKKIGNVFEYLNSYNVFSLNCYPDYGVADLNKNFIFDSIANIVLSIIASFNTEIKGVIFLRGSGENANECHTLAKRLNRDILSRSRYMWVKKSDVKIHLCSYLPENQSTNSLFGKVKKKSMMISRSEDYRETTEYEVEYESEYTSSILSATVVRNAVNNNTNPLKFSMKKYSPKTMLSFIIFNKKDKTSKDKFNQFILGLLKSLKNPEPENWKKNIESLQKTYKNRLLQKATHSTDIKKY